MKRHYIGFSEIISAIAIIGIFIFSTGFRSAEDLGIVGNAREMGAPKTTKPKADDPKVIAAGKELYGKSDCVQCHGPEGKGDGPAASRFPADKKPANFTSGIWKFGGDDATVRESIKKGRPPFMPGHPQFTDDQIASLSAFVRSLAPKK